MDMESTSHTHNFPLTDMQVQALLGRMDQERETAKPSKRRMERSLMRDWGVITVYDETDTPEFFDVPICNISPTGICFLHVNHLNHGQRLTIQLPRYVTSGAVERDIIIMRTREISASIVEIGAELIPDYFD